MIPKEKVKSQNENSKNPTKQPIHFCPQKLLKPKYQLSQHMPPTIFWLNLGLTHLLNMENKICTEETQSSPKNYEKKEN